MDKQKISMINLAVSKLIPTFVGPNIMKVIRGASVNAQDFLRAFFMPLNYNSCRFQLFCSSDKIVMFGDRNFAAVSLRKKTKHHDFMNTFEFFDQCLGLLPASATLRACKVRTIQGTTTVSIAYMVGSQIYRSLFEQKGGING